MEYRIIGGGNIAYFDNSTRAVRQGAIANKGQSSATTKKSGFETILQSTAQSRKTETSAQQGPALKPVSPPSPAAVALTPTPVKPQNLSSVDTFSPSGLRVQSPERSHRVKAGDTIWELAVKVYQVDPKEIARLNNISDPRKLQIGQVLRIPGKMQSSSKEAVVASWYGKEHHGRPMANGVPYDMHAPTIAHKELPLGTRVLLENPATGEKATATVTDRGPYIAGRDVDLSYHLAQRLSLERQGVGSLTMEIL
jgi:rare lipoprotein A (peptidoglycan hydrolase)